MLINIYTVIMKNDKKKIKKLLYNLAFHMNLEKEFSQLKRKIQIN